MEWLRALAYRGRWKPLYLTVSCSSDIDNMQICVEEPRSVAVAW
jgi:hypothetical protein